MDFDLKLGRAADIISGMNGRHVTVFGSAPGRVPPQGYEETFVVTANGAMTGLARNPDLAVIGASICKAATKTCRHTLRNLNARRSDSAVFVNTNKTPDYAERFRDFGFDWREEAGVTAEERGDFVEALTGYRTGGLRGPHAHSNGVFAILLAAAAGARRIDICGFSFRPGHFYIENEATPRNHVDHDSNALEWLAGNATVYATDAEMCERFGFREVPQRPARKLFGLRFSTGRG